MLSRARSVFGWCVRATVTGNELTSTFAGTVLTVIGFSIVAAFGLLWMLIRELMPNAEVMGLPLMILGVAAVIRYHWVISMTQDRERSIQAMRAPPVAWDRRNEETPRPE